jgi:hypothetical protein
MRDNIFDDNDKISVDGFYADDVQAAAIADNNLDPELLKEDDDYPVTSGNMNIGDLDTDSDYDEDISEDEETFAGSDNVVG